jgi:hypothetical protein
MHAKFISRRFGTSSQGVIANCKEGRWYGCHAAPVLEAALADCDCVATAAMPARGAAAGFPEGRRRRASPRGERTLLYADTTDMDNSASRYPIGSSLSKRSILRCEQRGARASALQ